MSSSATGSRTGRIALLPDWLFHYQMQWVRADVVAGLTASAVVIPKALAYDTIAGMPVLDHARDPRSQYVERRGRRWR